MWSDNAGPCPLLEATVDRDDLFHTHSSLGLHPLAIDSLFPSLCLLWPRPIWDSAPNAIRRLKYCRSAATAEKAGLQTDAQGSASIPDQKHLEVCPSPARRDNSRTFHVPLTAPSLCNLFAMIFELSTPELLRCHQSEAFLPLPLVL